MTRNINAICPKCNHSFVTSNQGSTARVLDLVKNSGSVLNVTSIAEKLKLSRPVVYIHLDKLKKQGLIETYHIKLGIGQLKGNPLFVRWKK